MTTPYTTMESIIQNYQTILFDAFGVLVNSKNALPGAIQLIDHLNKIGKSYFVVTNGSRMSIEKSAQSYKKRGLNIKSSQVISSGSLIQDWVNQEGLHGAKTFVLGPECSTEFIQETGLELHQSEQGKDCEVIIISNQDGFDFEETINALISNIAKQVQKGRSPRLLLPNPDVLYPKDQNSYGITSGAIAALIESCLSALFPSQNFSFEALGKPNAPIFLKAKALAKTSSLVMIGDQIQTDILGANQIGIDSVLIGTGLLNLDSIQESQIKPTYFMTSLDLSYK